MKLEFPEHLPISSRMGEIGALYLANQVVVVAGETGSGKSTQLPKLPLLHRADSGQMVAHTQPRRIAAREIAARVSTELQSKLGGLVGYRVRFKERISTDTRIKVLTDGMLLAEMDRDRRLSRYHTIIVDEAHERSLNIDFILGYLSRLLVKRPDLKLIVTSATIDTERFSKHFGDAPVVEVSGRTYPVQTLYPEPPKDQEMGSLAHLANAVKQAWQHGVGDMLVFLPGEREIREAREFLSRRLDDSVQILTLYARLSPADQKNIFSQSDGRRIILSTNVAETSLTVPGIRYVIDSGLARVSRYSATRKIQRLPIEKISQASANQRKGRCGRVQSGICLRLFSEQDFIARPEYSDPEILRTSLASIILKMKSLNLGDMKDFPFIDRPDYRQIRSATRLLVELSALDENHRLTATGRRLSRLPVDPQVGRLLIEGERNKCLPALLVIGSRLSVQDVEIFPREKIEVARTHHKKFPKSASDIQAILDLWQAYQEQAQANSRRGLERWCESNFLSAHRMREWVSLHSQLQLMMGVDEELDASEEPDLEGIGKSIVSGFLGNVCRVETRGHYAGTQNKKIAIHPSSRYYRSGPKWLVTTALVDSSRLFARSCMGIHPEWVEKVAGSQIRLEYTEPWWDARSGNVMALQSGTLQGLRIFSKRRKNYGAVNRQAARQIFIQQALVEMRLQGMEFANHNRDLKQDLEAQRDKTRSYEFWLDEAGMYAQFDQELPEQVVSTASLKKHLKTAPDLEKKLMLDSDQMTGGTLKMFKPNDYPEQLSVAGNPVAVTWRYQPGEFTDGVGLALPLPLLNQFDSGQAERELPGWFHSRVEGLIRSLPKAMRRPLVPLANSVPDISRKLINEPGDTCEALASILRQDYGIKVTSAGFDETRVEEYLKLRLDLIDQNGEVLASSRNIGDLKQRFGTAAEQAFQSVDGSGEQDSYRRWSFADIDRFRNIGQGSQPVRAFSGLVDNGDSVSLGLFDHPDKALKNHRAGLRRLIMCYQGKDLRSLKKQGGLDQLALRYAGLYPGTDLVEMVFHEAIGRATGFGNDEVWTRLEFEQRLKGAKGEIGPICTDIAEKVSTLIDISYTIRNRLEHVASKDLSAQINQHCARLVGPDAIVTESALWLHHKRRFLSAVLQRLDRYARDPNQDAVLFDRVRPWFDRVRALNTSYRTDGDDPGKSQFILMVEEYFVSVFAQNLGTSVPISAKRLERQWQTLQQP